jgi:hypothetical protein
MMTILFQQKLTCLFEKCFKENNCAVGTYNANENGNEPDETIDALLQDR